MPSPWLMAQQQAPVVDPNLVEDVQSESGVSQEAGMPMSEQDIANLVRLYSPRANASKLESIEPHMVTARDMQGPALAQQYANAQQQALIQEQQASKQYEDQVNQLAGRETQVNLKPLLALADAWNPGSHLADSYQAPMNQQQKDAMLLDLQGKLAERKNQISQSRTSALKAAIDSYKQMKDQPLKDNLLKAQTAAYYATAGVKEGGKVLPETSIQKVTEFDNGLSELVNNVKPNIEKNSDVFGPVVGRLGAINPSNIRAQSVQSDLNAAKQLIGKAVEGGVLRKEDEEKYMKILPVLSDEPEVAKYKMTQFVQRLSSARNNYLRNLKSGGYNTRDLQQKDAPQMGGLQRLEELRKKAAEAEE